MAFNICSRLIGGIILDNVSFKTYFSIILVISTLLGMTYDLVAHIEELFILYLAGSYFVTGSIFVSLPIYYANVFGAETGSKAYSYFFSSNAAAMMMLSFIVSNFQSLLGYSGMLMLTGFASLLALILLNFLSEKPMEYGSSKT